MSFPILHYEFMPLLRLTLEFYCVITSSNPLWLVYTSYTHMRLVLLLQRVYSEAEEMAKKYRQKMPSASLARKPEQFPADTLSYEDEENLYSNWKWFKFELDNVPE